MKGWLWRPNNIRGPCGHNTFWHLPYSWGKNPEKNHTQETFPDRGSNPGPLRDRCAWYRLLHSVGLFSIQFIKNWKFLSVEFSFSFSCNKWIFNYTQRCIPSPLFFMERMEYLKITLRVYSDSGSRLTWETRGNINSLWSLAWHP